MKINYDDEYRIGRSKVYMVSPENEVRLGRKMTKDEIQLVLDDIAETKSEIYASIERRKQKGEI